MDDINFNLTNDMIDILQDTIKVKERLENENLNQDEREKLEKQFIELRKQFVKEFRKNNVEEIKKYNEVMNDKNFKKQS